MSKTGFVFPGQGSQFVGMAKDLTDAFPVAKTYFEKASDILDFDLMDICFNGPEETLKRTQYTQPAIFTHSAIVAAILSEKNIKGDMAAGHSLGEFAALAYTGAFSFEDGLKLVAQRGKLMQQAGEKNPGTMAAIIGLDTEVVFDICKQAESAGIVQPANLNSPGQIVISGSVEGVRQAMALAKEKNAKRALELPVSGAFHSPLMAPVAEKFETVLGEVHWQTLNIPVYPNVTAAEETDYNHVPSHLKEQLTHSVRWIETVENMIAAGVTTFIEAGPGKVLSGLIKRINRDVEIKNFGTAADFETL